MRRLRYSCHMQLKFEKPVSQHHFKLRCFPSSDERQKIFDERVEIYPVHFSETERDSFGNLCVYGTANQTHERFAVDVDGFANIYPEKFLRAEVQTLGIFKYKTRLTEAGKNIRQFHEKISRGKNITGFEKVLHMMKALHENFCYTQGVTNVTTTAEESFTLHKGVCQDYAHIFLALCRLEKIPCRYVAGLIPGEGATHAWTEIFDSGFWRAIDPTHDKICDEAYIKISSGRDALDCSINQGGGHRRREANAGSESDCEISLSKEKSGSSGVGRAGTRAGLFFFFVSVIFRKPVNFLSSKIFTAIMKFVITMRPKTFARKIFVPVIFCNA